MPAQWLELDFNVEDMVDAYPGSAEATARFAPQSGPYAGDRYTEMFAGMKTKFDDTIVLEERGGLIDKMLIEYKTAKSSLGRAIDGNAHERLSFQIMQYLEVATTYTSCSLTVLTNGAFSRYRNKYHVNFHIQADRLSALPWFSMDHLCTREEFSGLARRLASWLFENDT